MFFRNSRNIAAVFISGINIVIDFQGLCMKLFEITERSVLSVFGEQPQHYNDGDFHCGALRLTTLYGSPETVSGNFDCSANLLTSLEHAPQIVGGRFSCYGNNIKSYHNVDKIIKQIKSGFYCDIGTHMLGIARIKGIQVVGITDNRHLTQIFNDYLHDIHLLQDALIDAGYVEQARL